MAIIKSEDNPRQVNLLIHRLMKNNTDLSGRVRTEVEDHLQTIGLIKGKEFMCAVVATANAASGFAPFFHCCATHRKDAEFHMKIIGHAQAMLFLPADVSDEKLEDLGKEIETAAIRMMELIGKEHERNHGHG